MEYLNQIMAIGFVKSRYIGRSTGGNACRSSAYNARSKIIDNRTGEVFDFTSREGNVSHEILLSAHVDEKFKSISILSNEIEACELRKDSQLYVEWVLALPKEKEVTLEMKKEMTVRFIEYKGWLKEGLGVQIDIHEPHENEINWHAHLLTPTRRFTKDGSGFDRLKARDLQPQICNGRVVEETKDSVAWTNIQNDYFREHGLGLRVDLPGEVTQEHIGPVRMRSVLNQAVERNEDRRVANIGNLKNGRKLLDYVTNHISVFNESDLKRAVKFIPDAGKRERLVGEALADKSLLELFDESGAKTGYYTTKEIREEEDKLLRLSGYVAAGKNVVSMTGVRGGGERYAKELIGNAGEILSEEQQAALTHLLLNERGIRILRGRAGTGKSHVLGQVASIAGTCGVNVIGVAPTHKAKEELARKSGFDQNDTVKGMLFKLRNGRFALPEYSLLVADEAGMIGNEDYQELLRVAATRKCNVILAGDERQLASVQRGRMFEVFAESYGSATLFDIQRQNTGWGRSVAMAFSKGEVATGVSILQQEGRLAVSSDASESMQTLLAAWSKSGEPLAGKLIIAVRNKDVDALNHGARQYLKLAGVLSGEEISVGGHHYMKGDRILIKQTSKELGLTNGDLAEVVHVSGKRFVIRVGGESACEGKAAREIELDPGQYSGFRHGYATTVFKAQGVSIRDVFVFHDGFAGVRNSYVALSRHQVNLNLYINEQSTGSISHLIRQLGYDPETGSSLGYLTREELDNREIDDKFRKSKGIFSGLIVGALEFASKKITELKDRHLPDSEYYQYRAPEIKPERVEEVLDKVWVEIEEGAGQVQEKIAAGDGFIKAGGANMHAGIQAEAQAHIKAENTGNSSVNRTAGINVTPCSGAGNSQSKANQSKANFKSARERFYAKADKARHAARRLEQKAAWDNESEKLRHLVRFKTEQIARDLLGEPNNRLSNGRTLRWGRHGKLAVRVSGERIGNWYDFSSDRGGDIFALVQEKQGCDFKGAAEYLKSIVGMQSSNLSLVYDHRNSDLTENYIKARRAEEKEAKAKQAQVSRLYVKSRDIGDRSVAHKYLTQVRGITFNAGPDIRTAGIHSELSHTGSTSTGNDRETGKKRVSGVYLPAIIAFARDASGSVTGGQQILLDKDTGDKADVAITKRSFGKIAGSFVEVGMHREKSQGQGQDKEHRITVIAEGLETALSVKQSLTKDEDNKNISIKVLCSLGVSNIRNYQPIPGEKVIIAADNDGEHAITVKTINAARSELQNRGAFVDVVRPYRAGDFNDILQQNNRVAGEEERAGTGAGEESGKGEKEIRNTFKRAISSHTSVTLDQYFASRDGTHKLGKQEREDISYIQKFKVSEERIIDAYRRSPLKGMIELENTRKVLGIAESFLKENRHIVNEAKQYGADVDDCRLVQTLMGKEPEEMERRITVTRDRYYISGHLDEFRQAQVKAATPKEVIQNMHLEQKFLSGYYDNLKYREDHNPELINLIKSAHKNEQENSIDKLTGLVGFLEKNTGGEPKPIIESLKKSNNPAMAYKDLLDEYHSKTLEKIHTRLTLLDKGKSFTFDHKHFESPEKFLDHILQTRNHEYFPKIEVQKIRNKIPESNQKHLELAKGLDGPEL